MKRLFLALLLCCLPLHAWAVVTATITGTVVDGAGQPVANTVIVFNSQVTQSPQGAAIAPVLLSTTTDASGVIAPLALAQGLIVQVTIGSAAPTTSIVPYAASVDFGTFLTTTYTQLIVSTCDAQTPDIVVTCPPYNAVGNGIADDSAAVQAAITAAQNAGGGTVLFPIGTYYIASSVTVSGDNVRLVGASMEATTLKAGPSTNVLVVTNGGGNIDSVGLSDLTFDDRACLLTAGAGQAARIINFERGSNAITNAFAQNIRVNGCLTNSTSFGVGSTFFHTNSITLENIKMDGGVGIGLQVTGGVVSDIEVTNSGCNGLDLTNTINTIFSNLNLRSNGKGCYGAFTGSDNNGLLLASSSINTFSGVFTSGNCQSGVRLVSSATNTFTGVWSLSNGALAACSALSDRSGIIVTGASTTHNVFSGGLVFDNTDYGIRDTSSGGTVGNIFANFDWVNQTNSIIALSSLLGTTGSGVVEWTNAGMKWNDGTTFKKYLSATGTLDFASAAAGVCSTDLTITVTGAAAGDLAFVTPPNAAVNAGSQFTAWISAANTVKVRHCNISAGANDPASGSYRVSVLQH